jgi:hypothetical protein
MGGLHRILLKQALRGDNASCVPEELDYRPSTFMSMKDPLLAFSWPFRKNFIVISGHGDTSMRCPLYPRKQTFVGAIDASKLHWLAIPLAVIAKIAAPHASR